MTTYSPSLRLALQLYNENINTWGSVMDNQLTILDTAICGVLNIDVTGSVAVNFTTSLVQGGVSHADNAVLHITGVPTSSANITIPNVPKIYVIHSSTRAVGNNPIPNTYIKALGSSVLVTVHPTDKMAVYCNGSKVINVLGAPNLSNYLTKTGNLAGLANTSVATQNLGFTVSAGLINQLAGWTGVGTDLNVLHGLTLSTANLQSAYNGRTGANTLRIGIEVPSNTRANTISAAAWTNRIFNTTYRNNITGASLNINNGKIILPAGTYMIDAQLPQQNDNTGDINFQGMGTSRAQDITHGATLCRGLAAYSGGYATSPQFAGMVGYANISGVFTLAAQACIAVQDYLRSGGEQGPQFPVNIAGVNEVYGLCTIVQLQ